MSARLIRITVEGNGYRIDKYLADRGLGLSRSSAQRLIAGGHVTVNDEPTRASYRLRDGDLVVANLPEEESTELLAEELPLIVVYEDEFLVAIDKAPGMVVHPSPGHSSGTLVNALLARYPDLANSPDEARPGIVHRLDRDTSGLILVARREKTRRDLQRLFRERLVHKAYLALLDGHLQPPWGRIEAPLGRDPAHRQRMAVQRGGREAITEYFVREQFSHSTGVAAGSFCLVEAEPKTGRTHQIRVHFASIGHPVVGDHVYGRRSTNLPVSRQLLHAWRLSFRHPVSGSQVEIEAPLPHDFAAVLGLLRSSG